MSDHQPFSVTVSLRTPVILTQRAWLNLDSVLASLLFDRSHDLPQALRDIPLARTGPVWHGSAALLHPVQSTSSHPAFKRGISPKEEMWAPAYQTGTGRNSNKPVIRRVDTQRGEYKTEMDQYLGLVSERVTWLGCGQIDAVRDLLADLRYVGKKSRQGWGQVDRIDVEESDDDQSLVWRDAQGSPQPMRQVPVTVWQQLGHAADGLLQVNATICPPYFDESSLTRCVVPSSRIAPWAKRF